MILSQHCGLEIPKPLGHPTKEDLVLVLSSLSVLVTSDPTFNDKTVPTLVRRMCRSKSSGKAGSIVVTEVIVELVIVLV